MMRKLTVTAAVLGLTVLGPAVPATAAQATGSPVTEAGCDSAGIPGNGRVYAWDAPDCQGTPLPDVPVSGDWGAGADNRASSVMARGFLGGLDHVAFFDGRNYSGGHVCLAPGELYSGDLANSRFTSGLSANNAISAHRWVNRSACGAFLT
jgi:hypothetical protein